MLLIHEIKLLLETPYICFYRLTEIQTHGDQALLFKSLLLRSHQTIGMETVAHNNSSARFLDEREAMAN